MPDWCLLSEQRENLLQVLAGHSDAAIVYQEDPAITFGTDTDSDRVALPELDGVGNESRDDLFDSKLVPCTSDSSVDVENELGTLPEEHGFIAQCDSSDEFAQVDLGPGADELPRGD